MTTAVAHSSAARSSLVVTAGSICSGLLNAGALILSARQGDLDELASYTVVTATLVTMSVALAGASTMLYVSGNNEERQCIRAQRVIFIQPVLLVGLFVVGAFYTARGYSWLPIAMSGAIVMGNNIAELQYGDLTRQFRFMAGAAINCGSKVPAVALIALGIPLTSALAVAVVVQFILGEMVLGAASWTRQLFRDRPRFRDARAAFRLNRHMHAFGLAELYNGRIASIGLSVLATPQVLACFAGVLNIFQAFATVLYAGLQVSLAARVRSRLNFAWGSALNRHVEALSVIGAVFAAGCLIVSAEWIVEDVLQLPLSEAVTWLRILAIALPFFILNRTVMLAYIGEADYRTALRISVTIAIFLTLGLAIGLPEFGALGTVTASLSAEAMAAFLLGVLFLRRRTTAMAMNGVR